MQKLEGSFANVAAYQEGLQYFTKIIEGNSFYTRLSSSKSTKENITFRTSTALGANVEGLSQMYVHISATKDVDLDTFDFTGVTNQTPRTLRLTITTELSDRNLIAATLLHEFLVHGQPFQSLFDSINSETDAKDMARFWRKSRESDNSGYQQHAVYGAGLTKGLDEALNYLGGKNLPNKDSGAILKELEKDIKWHKERFPLKK